MLDMHIHSTASDGTDTPETIIEKCARLGLALSAITDHDTIDGQAAAESTAARRGIRYLRGVEYSVKHEGELHVLGYGIDVGNKRLLSVMEELRASRVERVERIIEKLRAHNVKITKEDVIRNAGGNTLGRPHIAKALIEKGYVADFQEAFGKYLNEGGLCYVKRYKLSQSEAFELIIEAGGTPVLAHPKFIRTNNIEKLVAEAKEMGLEGIEAYYPAHSDADVVRYEKLAQKYELLVTSGSDYHGAIRERSAIASEKRTSRYLEESVGFLIKKYL